MRLRFWKPEPELPVDDHVAFIAGLKSDTPIYDEMLQKASASIRASLRRTCTDTPVESGDSAELHLGPRRPTRQAQTADDSGAAATTTPAPEPSVQDIPDGAE